eukprot:scaffold292225_cov26-Tisochrysis_lutea.AAC.1
MHASSAAASAIPGPVGAPAATGASTASAIPLRGPRAHCEERRGDERVLRLLGREDECGAAGVFSHSFRSRVCVGRWSLAGRRPFYRSTSIFICLRTLRKRLRRGEAASHRDGGDGGGGLSYKFRIWDIIDFAGSFLGAMGEEVAGELRDRPAWRGLVRLGR